MFSYEERNSLLHRLNPLTKLALILVITVLISLSLFPALPLALFLLTLAAGRFLGGFTLRELLSRVRIFLLIGLSFVCCMLVLKGIGGEGEVRLWFLSWGKEDFVSIFALGLRMIAFAFLSQLFVLTTRPNDLVMSLILQLRLSPVHGYAALAAYRFLPTLQEEVKSIRLAQEIRGVEWEKGLISRLKAPFRLLLPLLCSAARRGTRVAAAMESRGLRQGAARTYYRKTSITRADWLFFVGTLAVLALLCALLSRAGWFHFSAGFDLK
ncbi:MAG: energy-coupling factor transporter transmembrane protein EcfT [Clostridia bacterium]|nr:energy-coupling factor transporter transmembrane protein EcfT [Clostridia bacterium]